jgi:hypothetical protein
MAPLGHFMPGVEKVPSVNEIGFTPWSVREELCPTDMGLLRTWPNK